MIYFLPIILFLFIVAFDFLYFGFLPRYLNIWPALDNSIGEVLIKQTLWFGCKKDFKYKVWGYLGNPDFDTEFCLLLTTKFLLIKNTRLTYVWRVDVESIKFFEVKNSIIGKIIIFYFIQEGQTHFLKFPTLKFKNWFKHLSEIGIPEREKGTNHSGNFTDKI